MTDVKRKLKSTMTDIAGKSWSELCESSQSSQSQDDIVSPLKNDKVKSNHDDDELYDLVFKPVKNEIVKNTSQDDISLTSFMNNVHMVTPIKHESDNDKLSTTVIIDEDTICSPFIKDESHLLDRKPPQLNSKEECIQRDVLHAKRRLTSECGSMASDPIKPEQTNKVHKKSTEHKSIHDNVENPNAENMKIDKLTKLDIETDALILARRQKQIDFGKNTVGYEKYVEQVPKTERKKEHPKTPPKNLKYTRRAWDGLVKNWRVRLHCWDPDSKNDDDDALTTGSSSNLYSLGSMTSLDSNSQASDSRPSTPPPTKRSSENVSHQKWEHDTVLSPNPVKFKKSKTENK